MREIADVAELLAGGLDHEDGVADGVTGREDRVHPRHDLLPVLDELDAVAHGLEVLVRGVGEDFELGRHLAAIGPEVWSAWVM